MTTTNDVEVDARQLHPGVVFFQDRLTRYTVAVEATTGRVITRGVLIQAPRDAAAARVLREVWAYQDARREVR